MFVRLRSTLLLPLLLLSGCGVTPTATPPPSTAVNFTGDWIALVPPDPTRPGVISALPVGDFMGALQSSSGIVTGTVRAISLSVPQCVSFTQDLPVTGTIDARNNLSLSIPISGGAATITATIADTQSYTAGTWQILGGACAMPPTTIQIAEFAPVTGTYAGVLNAIDPATGLPLAGTATNVTAVLVQSTTPDAHGQFPLIGPVTTTGACTTAFSLNTVVQGGLLAAGSSLTTAPLLTGGTSPTGSMLLVSLIPYSTCSNIYTGTLTRQ